MRFIIASVPYGCDNIGDEAILAAIVQILRRNFDNPQITVATGKPAETAKLLNVNAVELYGFKKEYPASAISSFAKDNDVLIWGGATGLSDYPFVGVSLLKEARKNGLKTVVWGTGMDDFLNPAHFKLAGKKLALCKLAKSLSLGLCDFPKIVETRFVRKMEKNLVGELKNCALVAVRDPQTAANLKNIDPNLKVVVGADSAIILDKADSQNLSGLPNNVKDAIQNPKFEKIGLCISAQRRVKDMSELAKACDKLLEKPNRRMFFIPMNPITDFELMREFSKSMKFVDKTFMLENCETPQSVLAAASLMNVVISSRLHLLILSANVATPIVGISRGSKVDNFLVQFGFSSAGSVENCDCAALCEKAESLIANPQQFKERCRDVYRNLHSRLQAAELLLKDIK